MGIYVLFPLAAALLGVLVALVWRVWGTYADRSDEAEAHERELAALNNLQANRVSDQLLTRPLDNDSAWQTMVERGDAPRRPRRPPRR